MLSRGKDAATDRQVTLLDLRQTRKTKTDNPPMRAAGSSSALRWAFGLANAPKSIIWTMAEEQISFDEVFNADGVSPILSPRSKKHDQHS